MTLTALQSKIHPEHPHIRQNKKMNREPRQQEGETSSCASSFLLVKIENVESLRGSNETNNSDGSSSSSFEDVLALDSDGADTTPADGGTVISDFSGSSQVNGTSVLEFEEQMVFANGEGSLIETNDGDDISMTVTSEAIDECRVSFKDDMVSETVPTNKLLVLQLEEQMVVSCLGSDACSLTVASEAAEVYGTNVNGETIATVRTLGPTVGASSVIAQEKKITTKAFPGSCERYVHFAPDIVKRDDLRNALWQLHQKTHGTHRKTRGREVSSTISFDHAPVLPKRSLPDLLPTNDHQPPYPSVVSSQIGVDQIMTPNHGAKRKEPGYKMSYRVEY
ncbi:hypothetical protein IV203_007748 [Nitzschia inconspicua]|uniref:Uncharacterized protein n=1 Tax=Nitzschia inconspicua TaxID=303405 RepID=A0A9K3PLB5_9STRA|nr:hypothetical protein IV203_007748 [Nitzschia inconspicua]